MISKTIEKKIKEGLYARVAIDLPFSNDLLDSYYYLIPQELKNEIKPGSVVSVPFGKQKLNGYVLDIASHQDNNNFVIKPIHNILCNKQIWDMNFLKLAKWISKYYLTNTGTVLASSVNTDLLKNKGIVRVKTEDKKQKRDITLTLNNDQQKAFNTILISIKSNEHQTYLLHGVTSSGKTEVYLKLIEEVLKKDKRVIYLVPEIYMLPQIYERLAERFDPANIILWHSSLSKKERLLNFDKLLDGASILLGARSCILAPIKNIGLIVIDEAHDGSYKQASPAPRYDTIKVSVKRGEIENCPVILGTATPNISDYYRCQEASTILKLPNRIENVPMPSVNIVDLKEEFSRKNKNIISNILKHKITEALNKKEQIILLLNRRGYSSHVFCQSCGYVQYCKNCSVPLTYHKNNSLMICHHCSYNQSASFKECPKCKSPHFKYFGLGTQQLEEDVKKTFPESKIIRVDSDQLKRKDEYVRLWQEFASHKADILIGTQLVAKGIDLPNVTVVGVILADTMLNFPDYISTERAFQLLTQVTGRAGRGEKAGNVFIQTYEPEKILFSFIKEHDYKSFYNSEINNRKEYLYPPFTLLTRIIFQSYSEKDCLEYAKETLKMLEEIKLSSISRPKGARLAQLCWAAHLSFLGPAPCFFTKLHGKYRYHILCKTTGEETKDFVFNNLFKKLNKNAKVEMIIDVDSINLL